MLILSPQQLLQATEALGVLLGEPLTDMWRYAGLQRLEFGEQKPFINSKGEESEIADWALVVACAWRFDGPDGFVLCREHFFPERRDDHASSFYDKLSADPLQVDSLAVDEMGKVSIGFNQGYSLTITPDHPFDSLRALDASRLDLFERHQWFFMVSAGEDGRTLWLDFEEFGWTEDLKSG